MNDITQEDNRLDWVRKISLRSLMSLSREQLELLQLQADKDLFRAQLNKERIESAIQFQFRDEEEDADG